MKDSSNAADLIACIAILVAVLSGSLNLHLWSEVNRYQQLSEQQAQQIQTMERTLLLNR
jgi:uncharacterized protein YpmB